MHGVGLLPGQIDRLTPAELALCLDPPDDRPGPPHGAVPLTGPDLQEYARRWRSQTVAERLARAREGS